MTISKQKQRGAALIIAAIALLIFVLLLSFISQEAGLRWNKITTNTYASSQAYQAAEAGVNFGISYLNSYKSVFASDQNNFFSIINQTSANLVNVSLANGSKYTITYSSPSLTNLGLIEVKAVGTSADGTSSQTIREKVNLTPLISTLPIAALTAKSNVKLGGNSTIENKTGNISIYAGSKPNFSDSASSENKNGTRSTKKDVNSDVALFSSNITKMDSDTFFLQFFDQTTTEMKNQASLYLSGKNTQDYSSALNNQKGKFIWIEQSGGIATIYSTTVVGSLSEPVLLVVNGDLHVRYDFKLYGLLYVIGKFQQPVTSNSGNIDIVGGVIVDDNTVLNGGIDIQYDPDILNNLQASLYDVIRVPGSWTDF